MGGKYKTSEVEPILLESPTNQQAVAQMQQLISQPAPTVSLQGLGAQGQQLLGTGMNVIQQLLALAQNPPQAYQYGLAEIEKILAGGYNPMESPYYQGIRQEAEMGTEKAVAQMMHGQQMRGTLASTPGIQAEGELRALANAKTLQTLGSLYESERNRMSNAISQALGYAQYQPSLMGQALSGVSAMSPLATYSSDVANQQALANAQMQANWMGQQLSGLGVLSDYGTYYMPQQYYQPGPLDYLFGIGGAVGSIFK